MASVAYQSPFSAKPLTVPFAALLPTYASYLSFTPLPKTAMEGLLRSDTDRVLGEWSRRCLSLSFAVFHRRKSCPQSLCFVHQFDRITSSAQFVDSSLISQASHLLQFRSPYLDPIPLIILSLTVHPVTVSFSFPNEHRPILPP